MSQLKTLLACGIAAIAFAGIGLFVALVSTKRKLFGEPLPYTTGDEAP